MNKLVETQPNRFSLQIFGDPFRYEEHDPHYCHTHILRNKFTSNSEFLSDSQFRKALNHSLPITIVSYKDTGSSPNEKQNFIFGNVAWQMK